MPADMALPVLFRDQWLAVIDKPAGLMVHDSALARGETDFAADRLRDQFDAPVFLVHRLDRATSGCLLLAFDRGTASVLGKTLMAGDVEKAYLAVCRGWPDEAFTIDHALDGGPGKPMKKPAVTRFERLATCELDLPSAGFATSRYALLRAWPETGRFRQIRRHLKPRTTWSATPAMATAGTTVRSGCWGSTGCCCMRSALPSRIHIPASAARSTPRPTPGSRGHSRCSGGP